MIAFDAPTVGMIAISKLNLQKLFPQRCHLIPRILQFIFTLGSYTFSNGLKLYLYIISKKILQRTLTPPKNGGALILS